MMHYQTQHSSAALRLPILLVAWLLSTTPDLSAQARGPAALQVSPAKIVLDSPETTQQLLVTGDGPLDLTRTVSYKAVDASLVAIDTLGLVSPKAEGKTEIIISHAGEQARVAVEITGLQRPAPISFVSQVI